MEIGSIPKSGVSGKGKKRTFDDDGNAVDKPQVVHTSTIPDSVFGFA